MCYNCNQNVNCGFVRPSYAGLKNLQECLEFFESLSKCCSYSSVEYFTVNRDSFWEETAFNSVIHWNHVMQFAICCFALEWLFYLQLQQFLLLCTDEDEKSLFVFDSPPPLLKFCPVLNLGVQKFIL